MKGATFYRGTWLMPGSEALRLYEERQRPGGQKKLDEHIDRLAADAIRRGDVLPERPKLPVYDLRAIAARGNKTQIELDAALKDIREGRAVGVLLDCEVTAADVNRRFEAAMQGGVRRSAQVKP